MRFRFTFLLMLLVLATIPTGTATISTDTTDVPAPKFQSLNNTGTPAGSNIYSSNTGLTITYSADRFDVDGLKLLGVGSGLSDKPSEGLDFKKVSSQKAKSFYEVKISVTSYTYFWAYAWSGSVDNGTTEVIDLIGNTQGHELWVDDDPLYPEFNLDKTNATQRGNGDLYVAINHTASIQYTVEDPNDEGNAPTLVWGENASVIFSDNANQKVMTAVDTSTDTKVYNVTIGLNDTNPIVYFTAFNDYGWERVTTSPTTPIIHRLTNGFTFNETFTEDLDLYTPVNDIEFNITTYNQTSSMEVGYQFRYFANDSTDIPEQDWSTKVLTNTTFEYVNYTDADGVEHKETTVKTPYEANVNQDFSLAFEIGNVVEIKSFVRHGDASNQTLLTNSIEILDPHPELTITSKNNSITNKFNSTIVFDFSTPKGDISTATLNHTLPTSESKSLVNIKSLDNYTVSFLDDDAIVEGNHTVTLTVTNSLGYSTVKTVRFLVDHTAPNATMSFVDVTNAVSTTGRVTVEFSSEDAGVAPSGVAYMTIDWGNNMSIDVTGLDEASFKYRRNGDYTITLTVYDKAGNSVTVELDVTISMAVPTQQTDTGRNPISLWTVLAAISFVSLVTIAKRRKINL